MRVIIYGVLSKELSEPHIEIQTCNTTEELIDFYLLSKPKVIVISEKVASEVFEVLRNHNCQPDIAVVASDYTPVIIRRWTAEGASHVWSESEWMDELCAEYHDEKPTVDTIKVDSYDNHFNDMPMVTNVIAVGGVYEGAGTTHISIMIANFLARTTKTSVAIWEAGNKPCFHFLDYYNNGEFHKNRPRFELKNVTFFKAATSYQQIRSIANDFRFIVFDLGWLGQNKENTDLFLNSDVPILVGSGSEWRMREIMQFCQEHNKVAQDRWRITMPLAKGDAVEEMGEALRGRLVFNIPFHSDPFNAQDDTDQALEGVLSPILPKRKKRKFKFL